MMRHRLTRRVLVATLPLVVMPLSGGGRHLPPSSVGGRIVSLSSMGSAAAAPRAGEPHRHSDALNTVLRTYGRLPLQFEANHTDSEVKFIARGAGYTLRAKPGDFVLVPPGVPHGFANPVGDPATMVLLISSAAVHERYFEELAAILAKPGPPDIQAIAALHKRYDTEQVSPLRA